MATLTGGGKLGTVRQGEAFRMSETTTAAAEVTTLPELLDSQEIGRLTVDERRQILEQVLSVLEDHYALLGFKVAKYGINPLQRLRLMLARLGGPGELELEWRFHAELVDIFNSLRDLHTRYSLPRPFNAMVVYFPFLLKEFTEDGRRRYLVGRRRPQDPEIDESFRFGVEVTHWNGVPIARAVERFADQFPGANAESRHARAVDRFTFRPLGFGPPPDEEWVVIRYLDLDGREQFITRPWTVGQLVVPAPPPPPPPPTAPSAAPVPRQAGATGGPPSLRAAIEELGEPTPAQGVDVEAVSIARTRTQLFAPEFLAAEKSGEPVDPGPNGVEVRPEWSTYFEARRATAGGVEFGHLRIRTFSRPDTDDPAVSFVEWLIGFVNEFIRLLGELPRDGMVVDIRGNPGGAVAAAELCLQVLSARPIQPEPAQFAATARNLRICRANTSLRDWLPSMEQAVETGATHSAGVPLTPPAWFGLVPQMYVGPLVLIIDARCYSAADMFAAGFQDHGLGSVLGTSDRTGAGGANVYKLKELAKWLAAVAPATQPSAGPLPGGADLTFAVRRTLRVGRNAGAPLEDYGVVAPVRHTTTRADVTRDDADLMATAAALLRELPARRFDVELASSDDGLTVILGALGISRADVTVDGRPSLSIEVTGNPGPLVIPVNTPPDLIQVTGFDGAELVAVRTFDRDGAVLRPRDRLR
ncbi:peptidase S41 [Frankia sp. CNm7]|uniref:Tail specific protease domain-containing protein n=1 Tax=Frankia nepalensis TaxID=1836974 RepID=A0A937RLT4_9ACTN|nr:S41 family peptidase [Frankia nepalensis]MBL7499827.1 peptidase S41 [Frankia nepalensis]MBL7513644.1 peptidase S41 [Frankia nepalensis]MBL7522780.1 peptidase S41 [Frankia nepalensis]MBL7631255.1 hypothetical protein [Frankia nepalensis]